MSDGRGDEHSDSDFDEMDKARELDTCASLSVHVDIKARRTRHSQRKAKMIS